MEFLAFLNEPPTASSNPVKEQFFLAVLRGNVEQVRSLLKGSKSESSSNRSTSSPSLASSLVHSVDDSWTGQQRTALHYACYQGHADMARVLLQGGASMNDVDDSLETPLHHAIKGGQAEAVLSLLLPHCSQQIVELKNKEGFSALMMACQADHDQSIVIRRLLGEFHASIQGVDMLGDSILHLALAKSCVPNVLEILEFIQNDSNDYNASSSSSLLISSVNQEGETPLHVCKNPVLAERLIHLGANVQAVSNNGNTPLHSVLLNRSRDEPQELLYQTVGVLISYGANVHVPNHDGDRPIHIAARLPRQWGMQMHEERREPYVSRVLRLLVQDSGADVNALSTGQERHTALHQATLCQNTLAIGSLFTLNANADLRNARDETAIHLAMRKLAQADPEDREATRNLERVIIILLGKGVNLMATSAFGNAIHVLCNLQFNRNVVNILQMCFSQTTRNHERLHPSLSLPRRALHLVRQPNELNGDTPLHILLTCHQSIHPRYRHSDAWFQCRIPVLKELLCRGADPQQTNRQGNTALHLLCQNPPAEASNALMEVAQLLVERDISVVKRRNHERLTPLLVAAQGRPWSPHEATQLNLIYFLVQQQVGLDGVVDESYTTNE